MAEGILKTKSHQFSVLIVKSSQKLVSEKREYVLSKQLLRSGIAVGALIHEVELAQSEKDFVDKMSIALKEANESIYWIDLLKDTNYIDENNHNSLASDYKELVAMLVTFIKTTKSRM